MNCHLVYVVPSGKSKIKKAIRKIKRIAQRIGFPISAIGNRQKINIRDWPEISPISITKHLFESFSKKIPTHLYHISEEIKIKFTPEDIFIGHPYFPYSRNRTGVTNISLNSIKSYNRPRFCAIISPLHCNIEIKTNHINKDYLDSINQLIDKIDIIFAIMGKYWWDKWDSSPYAHWKHKMVRLDMAIDVKYFPKIKERFNPKGKRKFFYIGNTSPNKGTNLLSILASRLKNYTFGWIGGGKNDEIPGVRRISPWTILTPDFMKELARYYDIFITCGVADANPTTILEAMSWGFPVICTPQSGYYETDYLKNIYHDDIEKSIEVLNKFQFMEEEELMAISHKAREVVEREYNWDRFLNTIWETLKKKGVT